MWKDKTDILTIIRNNHLHCSNFLTKLQKIFWVLSHAMFRPLLITVTSVCRSDPHSYQPGFNIIISWHGIIHKTDMSVMCSQHMQLSQVLLFPTCFSSECSKITKKKCRCNFSTFHNGIETRVIETGSIKEYKYLNQQHIS